MEPEPRTSVHLPSDGIERPPSRADALEATWREYYRRAAQAPRHPAARDFLHHDLGTALARLIPSDASVLEVGCGEGDLLAALPDLPHRADAVICDRLCHSVLDIKALLTGLRRRLAPDGRIYLTAFSYLWEIPVRLAELAGLKQPAPTANWLSDSDFRNLYDIAGLEVVRGRRYGSTFPSIGSTCCAVVVRFRRLAG